MSSAEFWDLTWYDWGLWCHRILAERKRRKEDHELTVEMTRSVMALLANINRKRTAAPYRGSDFFTLPYDVPDDNTMVGLDNKEFLEIMKQRFGKKKKRG